MFKKRILSLIAAMTLACGTYVQSFGAINIPTNVKIGIYYGSSSVASVKVKATQGLRIGIEKNEMYDPVIQTNNPDEVLFRKDSYFVTNGNITLEYNPNAQTKPDGLKQGPIHILLKDGLASFDDANVMAQQLKLKGVDAYPAYNDSWQVWTGFFISNEDAQTALNDINSKALGLSTQIINPSMKRMQILATSGQIFLMFESSQGRIMAMPKVAENEQQLISINGKRYRGDVEFARYSDSDMTVINILPLEQYLYGVVPREIGGSSPIEAIKAQAVVARTYTIQNSGKYSKWGFNLGPTVADQAYGGYDWENVNSNAGVDQTAGKVVTYQGKIASVFYFSTSGGYTEDVKYVWGSFNYPYLISVEDKYERKDAPKSNWEVTLTNDKIKQILSQKGIDLGDILQVCVTEYSPTGRVTKLLIKGTKAEGVYEKEKARTILGSDIIYSQMYKVQSNAQSYIKASTTISSLPLTGLNAVTREGIKRVYGTSGTYVITNSSKQLVNSVGTSFKFVGKGWGHGIGMSQEGAIGMAKNSFTYDGILKWYFPGTDIQ